MSSRHSGPCHRVRSRLGRCRAWLAASRNAIKPSSKWSQTRRKAFIDRVSSGEGRRTQATREGLPGYSANRAAARLRCGWVQAAACSALLVGCVGSLDQVSTDFSFELAPYRLHGIAPFISLVRGEGNDFGGFRVDDALLVAIVQRASLLVHFSSHFHDDLVQLAAYVGMQAVPELGVGDQHVVQNTVVGFGDELLHFVHLLAVDVRVGVLCTVNHAGLQALVNLSEAHLARVGFNGLELLFQYGGSLYAEFQATGIFRLTQRLVGGQLLEAVVPVTQASDVFLFHGFQQCLTFWALLETVDGGHVLEQERQVEYLDLLGVLLEFGQRWGDQLHVTEQQRFHFLAVTEQRGVRVNLDLDLVAQTLFSELLEQRGTLAFRRVVGDHVGELDHDRVGRLGHTGDAQRQGARERLGSQFEHGVFHLVFV